MLTIHWDEQGVILEHFMHRGNNAEPPPSIRSKCHGLLNTGVLLQHGNACHHTG